MEEDFHYSGLFDLLNSRLQQAESEVFIAAPYVKIGIVEKLDIPETIASKFIFVCRWKLDDVLSRATDIEVYPLLRDKGIRVLLHPNLHAKYYRFDNEIFTGSANLTSNGLISNETGSLEALTKLLKSTTTTNFESKIIEESRQVDDALYSAYLEMLDSQLVSEPFNDIEFFWPTFSSLEEAWSIYIEDGSPLTLKPLAIPQNLEKSKLKSFLKIRINEFSNIQRIRKFLESGVDGRRFGEVRALIRDIDDSIDETSAWQNLMLLLLDLFPERYEYFRPNHTEIIISKSIS